MFRFGSRAVSPLFCGISGLSPFECTDVQPHYPVSTFAMPASRGGGGGVIDGYRPGTWLTEWTEEIPDTAVAGVYKSGCPGKRAV